MSLKTAGTMASLVFLTAALPLHASSQEVVDLPAADKPITVTQEDLYSVGSMAGEPWETFGRVAAIAFDGEGNLYILDTQNFKVVKVGPGGELLAEMGGPGGGPGEFGQPLAFSVTREGEVRVYDMGRQGFTVFNPDGTFKATVVLGTGEFFLPNGGLSSLPDGSMVDGGRTTASLQVLGGSDGPPARLPVHHFILGEGAEMSTAYSAWNPLLATGLQRDEQVTGGGFRVHAPPLRAFDPKLFVGTRPDGRLVIADTTTYSIKLVAPGGGVERLLRRPFTPREVRRRDRNAERDRRLEAVAARESAGGEARSGSVSTDGGSTHSVSVSASGVADLMRARIEGMEFGDFIPVLSDMAVDWSGRIWAERTGDQVGEDGPIDLIAADGQYVGTVNSDGFRIPDAFGPRGLVAYLKKDELDVPRVEVKRLTVR